jgi:ATP:corrinoid adenosyltransferase
MRRNLSGKEGAEAGSTLELAVEAAGLELKTCVIQFQEGLEPYDDFYVDEKLLLYLNIFPAIKVRSIVAADRESRGFYAAKEALQLARLALACGKYDLVILDELSAALSAGVIGMEEIHALGKAACSTHLEMIGMNNDIKEVSSIVPDIGGMDSRKTIKHHSKGREYETVSLH